MQKQEILLAEMPIKKLIWKMSTPAIISMLVVASYNIIDTIFVGQGVGPLAIAGTAIFFPVYMIVMALVQIFGLGATSMISRKIGQRRKSEAELVLGNTVSLLFVGSLIISFVGILAIQPLVKLFGATDTLLPYAVDYGRVLFAGTIFLSFAISLNNLIRAEGNPKNSMVSVIIGIVVNTIFDYIFIFHFDMGIAGAAWATVIGYACSTIYVLNYYRSNSLLKIYFNNLKIQWSVMREMVSIGMAGFVNHVSGSVAVAIINNSLAFYGGDLAIAGFGIVNRLMSFAIMPMFGIVQGTQPIIGYNYGAGDEERVVTTIKRSITITTIMASVAWIVAMIFPRPLLTIFTADETLISTSVTTMRIVFIFYFLLGFQVISRGMYQSMGRAKIALFISALRQVILLIPLVLILPLFWGLNGVWWSFAIADAGSFFVVLFFYLREIKLIAKHLEVVEK